MVNPQAPAAPVTHPPLELAGDPFGFVERPLHGGLAHEHPIRADVDHRWDRRLAAAKGEDLGPTIPYDGGRGVRRPQVDAEYVHHGDRQTKCSSS